MNNNHMLRDVGIGLLVIVFIVIMALVAKAAWIGDDPTRKLVDNQKIFTLQTPAINNYLLLPESVKEESAVKTLEAGDISVLNESLNSSELKDYLSYDLKLTKGRWDPSKEEPNPEAEKMSSWVALTKRSGFMSSVINNITYCTYKDENYAKIQFNEAVNALKISPAKVTDIRHANSQGIISTNNGVCSGIMNNGKTIITFALTEKEAEKIVDKYL